MSATAHAGLPLPPATAAELERLTDGLDADALYWLSGYLAALGSRHRRALSTPVAALPVASIGAKPTLTILYGSQTGNAKRVAESLARDAERAGLKVRLTRADNYPVRELANERLLYVVISTQGDGEPPDDARGFVDFLAGPRAPQLTQLEYAVLGLGDSSYPQFCAIAISIDARLGELGAIRTLARHDADVDVDAVARPWADLALRHACEKSNVMPALASVTTLRISPAASWSREHPFAASVLANQRISARGSSKEFRHLELSIDGSGLTYEPGDALGVWPTNPPALVDAVIRTLGESPERAVTIDGEDRSLLDWLGTRRELTRLTRPLLLAHAQRARHIDLDSALAGDGVQDMLAGYQLIDLLRRYPAHWDAQELVAVLRPLAPRLYSIASSRKAVGEEAHLTVALVRYDAFGEPHEGAASGFLAACSERASVPVFVAVNERFRLPSDAKRDIIMIGPGTGVAPFRGFLQQRAETAASGRNWLFFGNPHVRSDFLYQLEWQQALRNGSLHRLDVAFSRDQSERIYVQHAIRRAGRELYAWIEGGAHIYVCGATRMAADVDAALRDVFVEHGKTDADEAAERLATLMREQRYARDVY